MLPATARNQRTILVPRNLLQFGGDHPCNHRTHSHANLFLVCLNHLTYQVSSLDPDLIALHKYILRQIGFFNRSLHCLRLFFPLSLPLLPLLLSPNQLFHLTGNPVISFPVTLCSNLPFEGRELLPYDFCTFFVGLSLTDFLDSSFDLLVCICQHGSSLLLSLLYDPLFHLLDLRKLLLILISNALQGTVGALDLCQPLFQRLAVPCNLAKMPLHVHEIAACLDLGTLYNVFGESHLLCQFKGKRAARSACLKFEQRHYVLHVKLHTSVDNPLAATGIEFKITIMGSDDPKAPLFFDLFQQGLGNRPAGSRLCTGSELIYQHQTASTCIHNYLPHVFQVGAIGAKVILQGLLITNVYKDIVEKGEFRTFRGWNQEAALQHILQQTDSL
ncbi:hypothetical protein SDC9_97028 [bioreactor metagenome]|uniref:Uncharacterized protein n=1 Tax=bioreactor metagenome TaxID=1076179 RepID=A0A645AAN9_9ZZZZ